MSDGEGRGAEEADDEVQQVEQQTEGDGLRPGNAEWVEEEDEEPFSHPETGDGDGEDLGGEHRRHEGQQAGW